MYSLLFGFSINHRYDLVWELCGDLFHGEFHRFDLKDSNFGALGKKISNLY